MSREDIGSLCNMSHSSLVTCSVHVIVIVDVPVEGRLHSTVCMALCGLPAAFVWFYKPDTIEGHVLYHTMVVSINRYRRQWAYPNQSFAVCCRWQEI